MCDVHIGGRDEAETLRAVIETVFSTLEIDEVLAGHRRHRDRGDRLARVPDLPLDGDRLVLRAASPVHREFVGKIEMGFDEGVTGWAARNKRAALIRDEALDDPRMRYFPELEEERWQSMAAVPVTDRAGNVIGVIVLHTAAPREFTEDDVALLTHTATLVGGAIEDAQLYAEASERVAALTHLAEVSQRLAAATQHERLHEAATAGARGLLGADLCQLFRLESGGNDLRLVASDPPGAPGPRAAGRRAAARAARRAVATAAPAATCGPITRARRCSRRRSSPPTSSSGCSASCGRAGSTRATRSSCARSPTRPRWGSSAPS